MGFDAGEYDAALTVAHQQAKEWLRSLDARPVAPRSSTTELLPRFGTLSDDGLPADTVLKELAAVVEPGLMAIPSGRFFGWVMGGTLPAALGADWLVSAWDQNAGMRYATPGVVAAEESAAMWLLELLGLPRSAAVGFATGATAANFSCLAAARHAVLAAAGWDVERDGMAGGPRVRVLVGDESHTSVDLALRYLGLGSAQRLPSDRQGRLRVDALADTLAGSSPMSTIVCLQAGNLHSGAFDALGDASEVAHRHGAWVHVDGAFGLWAAASPSLSHLTAGVGDADSWATDAHKTLNVPYDCGVAIVREVSAMRGALGVAASYLIADDAGDPFDRVPEMSRRARGVPVWAALRMLGRRGVAELVEDMAHNAQALATALARIEGVEILNDVVYTQVSLAFGDDDRTRAVTAALIEDGEVWMSGSRWQGRDILRISVSNWSTDDSDVETATAAVRRALR